MFLLKIFEILLTTSERCDRICLTDRGAMCKQYPPYVKTGRSMTAEKGAVAEVFSPAGEDSGSAE